jgi:undecaprenyl-phosphate 4-deoxy-4-formamido-L-arabinose transferase
MHQALESLTTPPAGLSVVVPVYNSGGILPKLVERLQPVLLGLHRDHELILVNDGSKDDSWKAVRHLVGEKPFVRGINLMRNYGQHNALLAGIRAARFDTVVTMDDDLQHPPEELPRLLAAFGPEIDVLYGKPEQMQHGFFRDLSSAITKIALQRAMGSETARMVSAWRVFRTNLRAGFANYNSPFVNIDVLLTWSSRRFAATAVRHDPRDSGSSNYGIGKLIRHTLNMMTGFSVLPLQLASIVGFVFTLFGMAVLAYVVGRYILFGSSVAGFPFLASIIAIFSGAQLFALGIIGEYIASIHFRTMNRPAYTVSEDTSPCIR